MTNSKLLEVKNLSINTIQKDRKCLLSDISFTVSKNEIVGVVGESGSGKSLTALSIMGLLAPGQLAISGGAISFENRQLTSLSIKELMSIRGNNIGMIFQEPMSALNPSMRCGAQVEEILKTHTDLSTSQLKLEVLSLFDRTKLPNPDRIYEAYPHEISGGQKQRVMIAMAIACSPKLLIADEPTTALDVTVQKEIIELLKELQRDTQMSILFISHDLALVSEFADRVLVMYKGEIIESGTSLEIFTNPKHPYTRALIMARPKTGERLKRLPTVTSILNESYTSQEVTLKERQNQHKTIYENPPILEVRDVSKYYYSTLGLFSKPSIFKAVDQVSFKVYPGETLGLVGESGCGKSTLSNAIMLLDKPSNGAVYFNGTDITKLSKSEIRALRKDIQIIFQDPFASLNPRLNVEKTITEPMLVHGIGTNTTDRISSAIEILERVGLSRTDLKKYPHEFSGGQRQRIGIARAIALKPKLIICDESVSALDISVQAQVLNLLNELKEEFNFTYIFISHDLNVVNYMSDQLLVMKSGEIEESGEADSIYRNPKKDYTKKLIHAIPKGL
ncbi:ABC transporter ATP-binding protein [Winogradskyella aurantiaca]|uniref:ABC transporter ATP-binding protein n=1 Tax=Winogradskyella aurantiaca TaxID=2219558 RepID=UPI000E1D5CDB|nr:ABC transporter ATP-binding protein [Winogradskyella aurantiaca]